MKLIALILVAALAAPAGQAATASDAAQAAEEAAQMLRDSVSSLSDAVEADDQVIALTEVISGYEHGLAALRAGLREAALREAELRGRFDDQHERLTRVLGAMLSLGQAPEASYLLHPDGAEATARAAMMLSDIAPGLRAQAEALHTDLDEIAQVRALQAGAADMLGEGLDAMQEARRLLTSAASDRSHLPTRFGDEPAELKQLEASATSLDQFAKGITGMEQDIGAPMADFESAQGSLPLPVTGTITRRYDEPDAAGIHRPGIVIATPAAALVTTPWPATIRFRGPLLDYGNVMIIEPARDYLIVLAGLSQMYGELGDVLVAGEPLGLMGGSEAPAQEFGAQFVANAVKGGDAGQPETLYVELRQGKETLDPADWFVLNPIVGEMD